METIKVELYIHKTSTGEINATTSDMSIYGWTLLGRTTVEAEVPEVDHKAALIASLKGRAYAVMLKARLEERDIDRQIKAIEGENND